MIVTVICDVFMEENNGTVIAATNLIKFLKSRGHEVRVVCSNEKYKDAEGFYIVPNYNLGPFNNYVKKVGVQLAKPDVDVIKKAMEWADIVHIMVPLSLGLKSIKIAQLLNIPVTAGFHMQAENLTSHLKLNKVKFLNTIVYKFIYKHLYSKVQAIHYPTLFMKNTFENAIKKSTPAYVISNGVNSYVKKYFVEKPIELKDKIVILSTGRFGVEKCQDVLIKAVSKSKYADKIQLILAGLGPLEKKYKKLGEKLKNPPILKFFGRKKIIDVLNMCDIYVHPAQYELEGISCIEAITCGKLTIVSDSKLSATRNFAVDDRCIFKCLDYKDLAKKIDYFIENPEEKAKLEEKYLNTAGDYDQKKCMLKMEQMMKNVIKEYKK